MTRIPVSTCTTLALCALAQVALVRSPLVRALSAYRSKFACGSGDLNDHSGPVSKLLALLVPNASSYATARVRATASRRGIGSGTSSSIRGESFGRTNAASSSSGQSSSAISGSLIDSFDAFSRARGRGCFDSLLEWARAVQIAHTNRERFRYGLYEVRERP